MGLHHIQPAFQSIYKIISHLLQLSPLPQDVAKPTQVQFHEHRLSFTELCKLQLATLRGRTLNTVKHLGHFNHILVISVACLLCA